MRDIFDVDQRYLTDFAADPTVSLKVLEYLQSYRDGTDQVRKGMEDKIRALGAYALPAIIQSTFTIWSTDKSDKQVRDLTKRLIVSLCHADVASRDFLWRLGLQKNPFLKSREFLAQVALELAAGSISDEELRMLCTPDVAVLQTSPNLEEFIPLIQVRDSATAMKLSAAASIQHAKAGELKEALDLARIEGNIPGADRLELVHDMFTNIPMDNSFHVPRAIRSYSQVLESLPFTLTDQTYQAFVDAWEWVLLETRHPRKRNTYVEKSLIASVHLSLQRDITLLPKLDSVISSAQYVVRYWWQAMTSPGLPERKRVYSYFQTRDLSSVSDYYIMAILLQREFVILRSHSAPSWLSELADRCAEIRPEFVPSAKSEASGITATPSGNIGVDPPGGRKTTELT